jgi:hypothetical protein
MAPISGYTLLLRYLERLPGPGVGRRAADRTSMHHTPCGPPSRQCSLIAAWTYQSAGSVGTSPTQIYDTRCRIRARAPRMKCRCRLCTLLCIQAGKSVQILDRDAQGTNSRALIFWECP